MKTGFYYILFLALSSISFFKPVFIDPLSSLYNYFFGLLLVVSIIPVAKSFIEKGHSGLFSFPILLLMFSILISNICARLFWDQDIQSSFFGSLFKGYGYFIYFYLVSKNIDRKVIEKTIFVIGLMFIVVFLTSFIIYPKLIVFYSTVTGLSFVQRIFISGDGVIFLFYFLCLNKYKTERRLIWIVLLLAAFLCIVLNQTRVYIGATFSITLFYILKSTNLFQKMLVFLFCIIGLIFILDSSIFETFKERTQNDLNKGDNYIRIEAMYYFLTDFQPSVFTRIFGNGVAYGKTNTYATFIRKLQMERGYFIEDLGFFGLYTYFGIIAVIAYLIIFYQTCTIKLFHDHAYARMFIIFLLFTGFTSSNTFDSGFIIWIVFAFYLLEKGVNPFTIMTLKTI